MYGNEIDYVQTDIDGVFTNPHFTEYARTSGIQLDTMLPNQSSPYIIDHTI